MGSGAGYVVPLVRSPFSAVFCWAVRSVFAGRRIMKLLPVVPAFLLVACSQSPTIPSTASAPTVLLLNGSCTAGRCDSVEVLAFPGNPPNVPAGRWSLDLGLMTGPQLCVRLPLSARFVVSGPVDGVMRSDTTVWTPSVSLSLGFVAPSEYHWQAGPTTAEFLPARSPGWRATLPGSQVALDAACEP